MDYYMKAEKPAPRPSHRWLLRALLAFVVLVGSAILVLMWWWDHAPAPYDGVAATRAATNARGERMVAGTATTDALVQVANLMLDKRAGYLSNDVSPPGLLMDNVPNWEFGVLVQCRDLARALRNGFSRSQTQSVEDKSLREAEPRFSFTNDRWMFPSSESEYRHAIEHIEDYRQRLQDNDPSNARFYPRADNLADYLAVAESRLGSLSQRLSASVGRATVDPRRAMPATAEPGATADPDASAGAMTLSRTPWREIDDVFYEARGTSFALAQFLKAIEVDFAKVLDDKNARVGLQQVIADLEAAQAPIHSPVVLNGRPFGFFANHSLVMANYISRANAGLIELRELLQRG